MPSPSRPVVLCFSGHDPSGGAGIQADIETIASHQCHAASVITALTEQDTKNVTKLIPQNPDDMVSQANTLLADIPIKVIKIGLLGHPETALAVHRIIQQHPNIPVILDPILAAGGGMDLSGDSLINTVRNFLLPNSTVLTPNSDEARRLTGLDDLTDCGLSLLAQGCDYVLITGTHESSPEVSNRLFHNGKCIETYTWTRLPYSYHGSGCTLAASIAALMAQGLDALDAITEAQEFTWNALQAGFKPGKGQHIPNRLFWVEEE
jgi:hydroxymethylpyrimidine/phosphomethylpyrimidine kinase